MDVRIRKAAEADLRDIKTILSFYYLDTGDVEKYLPHSIVAETDDRIIGYASLSVEDVVELHSIAVLPSYRNKGVGAKLVNAILEHAAGLAETVYLRTTSPVFFEKKGFTRLQDSEKRSIWKDCAQCDKFDICRQIAMKNLLTR